MISEDNLPGKRKARFDPTINYGHVLTVVSFVIAGAGAYSGCVSNLKASISALPRSRVRCSSSPACWSSPRARTSG